MKLSDFWLNLAKFPWRSTALALRQRFREDQLLLTASSLTFTTMLSLVPMLTVALAVFTAFPMFAELQQVLQKWLFDSLIPDNIARQVLGYLTQFASKASKLGLVGLLMVLTTALTLMLTIDHTMNRIWRVQKERALAQRVLIYWAGLTLGPLLLAASLTMTSYVLSLPVRNMGHGGALGFTVYLLEFGLLASGMAGLYHFVPHTRVKWAHAWAGGLFVALGIELAKKLLTVYLSSVPTYSLVYGAFATLPILLLWVYVVWAIVLVGAVIAAYLPTALAGVTQRQQRPGWAFELALELLQALDSQRRAGLAPLTQDELLRALHIDSAQFLPVLEQLLALDWVGRLEARESGAALRLVLLADPEQCALPLLAEKLLIARSDAVRKFWDNAGISKLNLRDALE